jgi:hypothetical protein
MPVCIAGMHRSGTSMVTKMLQRSGLYLGPESDLIPSNPENRELHWENLRFVRVNAQILAQFYGAWDCPPTLPDDWHDERIAAHRQRAEAIIPEFAGREPWGWKDPRNCLTLPFWQSLLGPMPVVLVVRNPLEVAQSLRIRNGFSYALGLALWQAYNERLCASVPPGERIVTHYDRYFQGPEAELKRLLSFLGLGVEEEVIAEVRTVHAADLRHHEMTTRALSIADVSPRILDLYNRLCVEAQWVDTRMEPLDEVTATGLKEAMVRSGEDPDAAGSARDAGGGYDRRRQKSEEKDARREERGRRRKRNR